jgi:CRISPR-associated protein Cas5t
MQYYRIHIRGWTASFRYPTFISGFQPTLPVPPLTTIYGMLSAASGRIITPQDNTGVGYVFRSSCKAVDLETIYELWDSLKAQSNVVKREFLFEPELYLYLDNQEIALKFHKPRYPLLIGRSTELAMVEEIKTVDLSMKQDVTVGGTIIPFPTDGIYGPIQALPIQMTEGLPRKATGTQAFYLLEQLIPYKKAPLPFDSERDWGVWIYKTPKPEGTI